jgi:hypothetical protein
LHANVIDLRRNHDLPQRHREHREESFSLAVERTTREKLYSPVGDWIIKE